MRFRGSIGKARELKKGNPSFPFPNETVKFRKHRVCCVYACVHLETRIDAHAYVYGAVIIRFQCVKGDGVPRENGLEPSSWLAVTSFPLRQTNSSAQERFFYLSAFFSERSLNDQTRRDVEVITRNSATTEIHTYTCIRGTRYITLADRNSTVGSACRA